MRHVLRADDDDASEKLKFQPRWAIVEKTSVCLKNSRSACQRKFLSDFSSSASRAEKSTADGKSESLQELSVRRRRKEKSIPQLALLHNAKTTLVTATAAQ
jgi:hypothetical protein